MLYLISWSINHSARIDCWNSIGTEWGDIKEVGDKIRIIGRWHRLSGAGGVCICESDDHSVLNSWILNWSPVCNITVEPMVEDADARAALQEKLIEYEKRKNEPMVGDAPTPAPTPDSAVPTPAPTPDSAVPTPAPIAVPTPAPIAAPAAAPIAAPAAAAPVETDDNTGGV
mgnify:FL=1